MAQNKERANKDLMAALKTRHQLAKKNCEKTPPATPSLAYSIFPREVIWTLKWNILGSFHLSRRKKEVLEGNDTSMGPRKIAPVGIDSMALELGLLKNRCLEILLCFPRLLFGARGFVLTKLRITDN